MGGSMALGADYDLCIVRVENIDRPAGPLARGQTRTALRSQAGVSRGSRHQQLCYKKPPNLFTHEIDQNLPMITNPVTDPTGDQLFYVNFRSCDS
jgi:hypothetical protein